MKRTSGSIATIYTDKNGKPFAVFGSFEIYPAGTIGIPPKTYDSGKVTFSVKDIDTQVIIEQRLQANLKIDGSNWSIGAEPAYNHWTPWQGEPFTAVLESVKKEYDELLG